MSRAGRAVGRTAGATWRGIWWVAFPPVGWYMSRQARGRRRHNATVRAIAKASATTQAAAVAQAPTGRWHLPPDRVVVVPTPAAPYRRRVIEPEYGRPPVPPPPPWWGTPGPRVR